MSDDLRDEYECDYAEAKPNRFATNVQKGGRLVVLEPEVAAAFHDSDSVNAALRAFSDLPPGRNSTELPKLDSEDAESRRNS